MAEGPTTFNGPLHDDAASVDTREIVAFFKTEAEAAQTRDALLADGVDQARVTIRPAAATTSGLAPADDTLLGHIREAILPDDSTRATRAAADAHEVMLVVVPGADDADQIVARIQAGKPSRFDADLERWRNSPPSA